MAVSGEQAREGTLGLEDGRALGYREYGEPAGLPVFYLHGMPGSRLEPIPLEAEFLRLGVRLVALERPGYGLSSASRSSGLLDWPADLAAAADQLGIESFAVLGVSTGGKYAAACAYALPERVSRAAIVSGIGPPTTPRFREGLAGIARTTMTLAKRARPLALAYWHMARWLAEHRPLNFLALLEKELSEPDRVLYSEPRIREAALGTFREALRGGAAGVIKDAVIQARAWGFELEQIQAMVQLWHGDRDEVVPLHHSTYVAERIPHGTLNVVAGTGHLLMLSHTAEITRALIN
jgi:pimeloyl-ACP methyl ester carboxylesterase